MEDEANFAKFSKAIKQMCNPTHEGDDKDHPQHRRGELAVSDTAGEKEMNVGFSTPTAGKEEIINRHVGDDELNTIGVCRTYVDAQRQYASKDRDGSELVQVCAKIQEHTGEKGRSILGGGWPMKKSARTAPLWRKRGRKDTAPERMEKAASIPWLPFQDPHRQGPAAPGGKYNYIINGNMIAGFALVAFPYKWGESGIMTFIINQQGKLYERNLGIKTGEIARAMTEYNPDKNWTLVPEQDEVDK